MNSLEVPPIHDPFLDYYSDESDKCDVQGSYKEPIIRGDYFFNTGKVKELNAVDYAFLVGGLVIPTVAGIIIAHWKHRAFGTTEEHLVASRSSTFFPAGITMCFAYLSALGILGIPNDVYSLSIKFLWLDVSLMIAVSFCSSAMIPTFYRLKINSVYEYLEKRFDKRIRTLAAVLFIVKMTIYLSMAMYLPCLALAEGTGLNPWVMFVVITLIPTIYTTFGTMSTVIWTCTLQSTVLCIGVIALLIRSFVIVGSLKDVIDSAERNNRLHFFDFRLDPLKTHTSWTILIGGVFNMLADYTDQTIVHIAISCRSIKDAKWSYWVAPMARFLTVLILNIIGLYFSYLYENCDPVKINIISSGRQLLLLFGKDIQVQGMRGLLYASIICASLTTFTAVQNAISITVMEDFLKNWSKKNIPKRTARRVEQVVHLILCVCFLEIAYGVSKSDRVLTYLYAVINYLTSPTLGVLCLGLFFPMVNKKGAYAGFMTSLVYTLVMTVGKELVETYYGGDWISGCISNCNMTIGSHPTPTPAPMSGEDKGEPSAFFSTSVMLVPFLCTVISIVVGFFVSYLTGFQKTSCVDAKLIVPLADVLFPFYYLPETMRERLRFGVDHQDKWGKKTSKNVISWVDVESHIISSEW